MKIRAQFTFLVFALFMGGLASGCEEDLIAPPPRDASGRDAAVDSGGTLPDAGLEPIACRVVGELKVGPEELNPAYNEIDDIQVIARPNSGSEFLVALAHTFCPDVCDVTPDDAPLGPEHHAMRRAMLYTATGGDSPTLSEPHMVNLGIGITGETNARRVRVALVGSDRLVVAWLDPRLEEPINVWTQSVSLSSLEPSGTMKRLSDLTWPRAARRLRLFGGASQATAYYEDYLQGGEPTQLFRGEISGAGDPSSASLVQDVPDASGPSAFHQLKSGTILLGRTETSSPPFCDYRLGPIGQAGVTVQQDPSLRVCARVSIADGGTAYTAVYSGHDAIYFRPLNDAGEPVGHEKRVVGGASNSLTTHPALVRLADGYVLTYVERSQAGRLLRGALLDGEGGALGEFDIAALPSTTFSEPSVAISNDGTSIAVAWRERFDGNKDQSKVAFVQCDR